MSKVQIVVKLKPIGLIKMSLTKEAKKILKNAKKLESK